MGATKKSDIVFEPKVWSDHVQAYFERLMAVGQLAVIDRTLVAAPGETKNFPFWKKIGAAEEPDEDSGLTVDKMSDDSFSCTIKEVAKCVGIKKTALRKGAFSQDQAFSEAQRQIAQVYAEKVDADLIAEMNTSGNYEQGFTAAATSDVAKVTNIATGKIKAFGDRHGEAVAIFMHSFCLLDLLTDSSSGFLKADANDPFALIGAPGFQGRLLGMALFTLDTMPRAADISGKQVYHAFAVKPQPYGILTGAEMDMDMDYDMLHREYLIAADGWYGVKAFHAKVSAADKRIARMTFATSINA